MAFDFAKLAAEVQSKGQNQTVAQAGGGYELPAAGLAFGRLVAYYELGKHAGSYQGKPKVNDKVRLVFELTGPKYPHREFDGVKEPIRMSLNINKSLSPKGLYLPLMTRMNHTKDATHMIGLVGRAFKFLVEHEEKGDKKYANIKIESIGAPTIDVENQETGEVETRIKDVPQAITPLKGFVVDFADEDMWDSIKIDGEWEARTDDKGNLIKAAQSKNVIQLEIMKALNFKGMPIYDYAMGKITAADQAAIDSAIGNEDEEHVADEAPEASTPVAAAAAVETEDALAGVV